MNVGKVMPVITASYSTNKGQRINNVQKQNLNATEVMSKNATNAIKSQINFGSSVQSVQVGVVEDTPKAHVILNGPNKTKTKDIVVNTKEVDGGKKFEAKPELRDLNYKALEKGMELLEASLV